MKKRFLNLLSPSEAYEAIGTFAPSQTETIGCRDALGRVAARDLTAPDDVPHFVRSNMDGFAVRAADTTGASDTDGVTLTVVGEVRMGHAPEHEVRPGTAVKTATGAMMPDGADAVVIVENTEQIGDSVLVRSAAEVGQNTVAIGEDMSEGELIFRRGRRFKGADVGCLTGMGLSEVEVFRVPTIGVMATGDEIVEPEQKLGPGQVRNVNQYVLRALASECGHVKDYGVVGDTREGIWSALSRAINECDAVFISGGSSKGDKDLTRSAIETVGGAEIIFHGLAIAPGKPTILARIDKTAVMGLPGNPAAAAVVFNLFGSTLVRVLAGEGIEKILLTRPRVLATLEDRVRSTEGREDYVRVRLDDGGPWPTAVPIPGKSVSISTVAKADGVMRVPQSTEGYNKGEQVEVILF